MDNPDPTPTPPHPRPLPLDRLPGIGVTSMASTSPSTSPSSPTSLPPTEEKEKPQVKKKIVEGAAGLEAVIVVSYHLLHYLEIDYSVFPNCIICLI